MSMPPDLPQPPSPQDSFGFPSLASQVPYGQAESSWPLGLLGGLGAAVAGGIAWAVVVAVSDYEVGIVAWAIGALCGAALVRLAGGKGPALQGIAVGCALLGIVLGKYGAYVHELRVAWQAMLPGASQRFGYLSGTSFRTFRENLGDVFGGFDLLWATLAVLSAWRIPRAS